MYRPTFRKVSGNVRRERGGGITVNLVYPAAGQMILWQNPMNTESVRVSQWPDHLPHPPNTRMRNGARHLYSKQAVEGAVRYG